MEMGCYGIGVTRIVGAAIEQNHDERGIIWPDADGAVRGRRSCPIGYDRSAAVREAADALHDELAARRRRRAARRPRRAPGVMFADWELIGVPHRVVVGDRGLKDGKVEYQGRRDAPAHGRAAARDARRSVKGKLAHDARTPDAETGVG